MEARSKVASTLNSGILTRMASANERKRQKAKENQPVRTGRDKKGKKKTVDAFSYYLGVGGQQPRRHRHCVEDPAPPIPTRRLLGEHRGSDAGGGSSRNVGADAQRSSSAQSGQRLTVGAAY